VFGLEPVTRRDAAVGAIHSVLDEQNNEIDRLQTMVDQLTNHRQANYGTFYSIECFCEALRLTFRWQPLPTVVALGKI
jgi:hypothetical protein